VLLGAGVAVEAGAEVLVAPAAGVSLGWGVCEGVGDAPEEVALAVAVAVFVLEGVNVAVFGGVFVAGGSSTVKAPLELFNVTGWASGEEAAVLLKLKDVVPGAAPGSTSKLRLAMTPFGMTFWFNPETMTLSDPGDTMFPDADFSADDAAGPVVTSEPVIVKRELSKFRSKLTAETSAPSNEARLTAMLTFVAPGSPEPLPTLSTA
jgi:hypothetical protein